jgi:hypothetical protein
MTSFGAPERQNLTKRDTPFAGVIAHHVGPCPLMGHGPSFREATIVHGLPASEYFRTSGITACAQSSGGLCTFWMDESFAIYQSNNTPLVEDECLAPSTDANRALFGDFLGSLHIKHPERSKKRLAVEQSLGSHKFIELLDAPIRKHADDYFSRIQGMEVDVEEFAVLLTSHIDSYLPGVLDCSIKPLTSYIKSGPYRAIILEFFDKASAVISNGNPQALIECGALAPFVRDLLLSNFDAIKSAPDSNLIRQYFLLWGVSFSRDIIASLSNDRALEIGTIIIATYDTTALSLMWLIAYIESLPEVKQQVIRDAQSPLDCHSSSASYIDLVVLEAVRLGGSNPTALWRKTITPFDILHQGKTMVVPVGTLWWLDRWQSNRDTKVFPFPHSFNVENICALKRPSDQSHKLCMSLLARNRYDINSFSMLNTRRNPRKCPGRLFSVRMQALLIRELYSKFSVESRSIDLQLRRFSAMPKPSCCGFMTITPVL